MEQVYIKKRLAIQNSDSKKKNPKRAKWCSLDIKNKI